MIAFETQLHVASACNHRRPRIKSLVVRLPFSERFVAGAILGATALAGVRSITFVSYTFSGFSAPLTMRHFEFQQASNREF
jgi:hypothetical protein